MQHPIIRKNPRIWTRTVEGVISSHSLIIAQVQRRSIPMDIGLDQRFVMGGMSLKGNEESRGSPRILLILNIFTDL